MKKARNKSECQGRLVEISRYLDGDLTAARARTLERHLESCTCCAGVATGIRKTLAAYRKAGAARLPPAVRQRARARIKAILGE